jgi:hypothetical protein
MVLRSLLTSGGRLWGTALLIAAIALASGCSSRTTVAKLGASVASCLSQHQVKESAAPNKRDSVSAIGGILGHGGIQVPPGFRRQRFEAVLAECHDSVAQVEGAPIRGALMRRQIQQIWACLNERGFKLPAPDLSGARPPFDTSAVNTTTSRWKSAEARCVQAQ